MKSTLIQNNNTFSQPIHTICCSKNFLTYSYDNILAISNKANITNFIKFPFDSKIKKILKKITNRSYNYSNCNNINTNNTSSNYNNSSNYKDDENVLIIQTEDKLIEFNIEKFSYKCLFNNSITDFAIFKNSIIVIYVGNICKYLVDTSNNINTINLDINLNLDNSNFKKFFKKKNSRIFGFPNVLFLSSQKSIFIFTDLELPPYELLIDYTITSITKYYDINSNTSTTNNLNKNIYCLGTRKGIILFLEIFQNSITITQTLKLRNSPIYVKSINNNIYITGANTGTSSLSKSLSDSRIGLVKRFLNNFRFVEQVTSHYSVCSMDELDGCLVSGGRDGAIVVYGEGGMFRKYQKIFSKKNFFYLNNFYNSNNISNLSINNSNNTTTNITNTTNLNNTSNLNNSNNTDKFFIEQNKKILLIERGVIENLNNTNNIINSSNKNKLLDIIKLEDNILDLLIFENDKIFISSKKGVLLIKINKNFINNKNSNNISSSNNIKNSNKKNNEELILVKKKLMNVFMLKLWNISNFIIGITPSKELIILDGESGDKLFSTFFYNYNHNNNIYNCNNSIFFCEPVFYNSKIHFGRLVIFYDSVNKKFVECEESSEIFIENYSILNFNNNTNNFNNNTNLDNNNLNLDNLIIYYKTENNKTKFFKKNNKNLKNNLENNKNNNSLIELFKIPKLFINYNFYTNTTNLNSKNLNNNNLDTKNSIINKNTLGLKLILTTNDTIYKYDILTNKVESNNLLPVIIFNSKFYKNNFFILSENFSKIKKNYRKSVHENKFGTK